jgi:outer membrane receptor for ferrienterochelin and colicins
MVNARWTAPALLVLAVSSGVAQADDITASEPAVVVTPSSEPAVGDPSTTVGDAPASAQESAATDAQLDALAAMDIEQLLQAPTTVASARATGLRESPGVVTRITRDEILSSGARDLLDILSLVPGFFAGVDVQGTLGVGMRGLWGHEGKILFLLDGQPMTELSYSTTTLGSRVPVEMIEKIELLRGPGSARYGGFAELAVVNITLIEADKPGTRLYASGNAGQLSDTWGRQNGTAVVSHQFESLDGLTLTARAYVSQAHPSNAQYHDFFGNSYDMANNQRWSNRFATFGVKYKALDVRYMFEDYGVRYADGYDNTADLSSPPLQLDFISHHLSAQTALLPTSSLTITPRFEYHHQLPFNSPISSAQVSRLSADQLALAPLFYYDRLAERTVGALRVDWDALEQLQVSVGGEVNYDRSRQNAYDPRINTFAGESLYRPDHLTASFVNLIAFTEVSSENRYLNVTAGARYQHHSLFGSAFAPRLALSKVIGDFHVKALASQAFRSPGFENINLGRNIKPERLLALELEAGYRITSELLATINVFDNTLKRAIVYSYDPVADTEYYHNGSRTGSRGLETELRYSTSRGYVTASYAYYTAHGKNHVADYAVPGHSSSLLAAPNHKLAVHAHARVYGSLHADATGFLLSARQAQTGVDGDGNTIYGELAPAFVLNLFVDYRDLFWPGLKLGIATYNVTGQQFSYPQPYNGLHAALPGLPREYLARLSYEL